MFWTDKLQELNAGSAVGVSVPAPAIEEMVKLANLGAEDNPAAIETLNQLLAWHPGKTSMKYLFYYGVEIISWLSRKVEISFREHPCAH